METPAARAMVPKLAEALKICRDAAIRVIFTAHVHRRDGCDMGLFDDMHPPIANRDALVDGTPGVDIYPELAPASGEHIIKKHRYSGFFGTDLDIISREWGIDTVIISGTTTENCCHATARDAMFRNYRVVFLSDATATYDYPDRGFGPMPNADVHHATLVILAASTAHMMSVQADTSARGANLHCRARGGLGESQPGSRHGNARRSGRSRCDDDRNPRAVRPGGRLSVGRMRVGSLAPARERAHHDDEQG